MLFTHFSAFSDIFHSPININTYDRIQSNREKPGRSTPFSRIRWKPVHLRDVQIRQVIQLCIRKFTGYDLRRKAMGKVVELEGEIESKRALQQSYWDIAQELHENYSAVMKRIIRFAEDDVEADL